MSKISEWTWQKLLGIVYALSCFFLASAFIGISNVHVRHRVQLLGGQAVLPQNPLHFWARIDLPPQSTAQLTLSFGHSKLNAQTWSLKANASGRIEQSFSLTVPNTQNRQIQVDLQAENAFFHPLSFEMPIASQQQISIQTESKVQPWSVRLIPQTGFAIPHQVNRIYLLIAKQGRPISTPIKIRKTYGDGEIRHAMDHTNAWGLASLDLFLFGETDWAIQFGEDFSQEVKRTLKVLPSAPHLITQPIWFVREPLGIQLRSVHTSQKLYLDLFGPGQSWLLRREVFKTSLAQKDLLETTLSLTQPMWLELYGCFSAFGCETLAQPILAVSQKPRNYKTSLKQLMDQASPKFGENQDPVFRAWKQKLNQVPQIDAQTYRALTDVMRAQWAHEPPNITKIFDSDPILKREWKAIQDQIKGEIQKLLALILIAGALWLGTLIIKLSLQRKRAFEEIMKEAEHLPSPWERWLFYAQILGGLLILLAFLWATHLLFQKL